MEERVRAWNPEIFDEQQKSAIKWSVIVAAGNAGLMATLASVPLMDPLWQAGAGSLAIFLHGWGVWEIGKAWKTLAECSKLEALMARLELFSLSKSRRRRANGDALPWLPEEPPQ